MTKLNYINKIIIILMFSILSSCTTIIKNLIGNQLIDNHYAPKPQIEPFYIKIPYKIENNFIVIKAKVYNSDNEYNFIFDTGGITMISEDLSKVLGLKNGNTIVSRDINGSDVVGMTYLTNLKIGDLNILNLRINTTKSELFSSECTENIDGIIGANVLKQGTYFFNASERLLIITNQNNKISFSNFDKPTKLKRFMGQPYIGVKGHKKEWLLFDTGYAGGGILVNKKAKILKNTDTLIKQKYYQVEGVSSTDIKTISYFNKKVNFGKTQITLPIIEFNKKHGKGNVGNKIIQNNDFIIDVLNKKFYFPKKIIEFDNEKIPNINFKFKNRDVTISGLTKNCTIEKMGIQMNDTVVKINDMNIKDLKSRCQFDDFKIKNIDNADVIKIVLKNKDLTNTFTITKKELYE